MTRSGVQKIVQKSSRWAAHGKHAKIDPHILNPPKAERPTRWFSSLRALFGGRS